MKAQNRKMCVSLAEPYTTDSFFARIPVEFVVRFLRYKNLEKVFTFLMALVSTFDISVQLMFMEFD